MSMDLFWTIFYFMFAPPAIWFAFGEAYAIITKKETLTRRIRKNLGIAPRNPRLWWAWALFGFGLLGFGVWFIPHIEWAVW